MAPEALFSITACASTDRARKVYLGQPWRSNVRMISLKHHDESAHSYRQLTGVASARSALCGGQVLYRI
jgi:predicted DNA-binding protein (MmcQ/YjbR family)